MIQVKTVQQIDATNYKRRYVGCIVLTQDHKILLQQRGNDWNSFPGFLATFGGSIEANETPMQALVRELQEELGAEVKECDVISLGAITEEVTKHSELIYVYFWYDAHDAIKGCFEGKAKYYDNINVVLHHPKVMDDVRWLLQECQNRQLLN